MDTSSPVEELVEAKQELLEEIESLCERRDEFYGDCALPEAVKALRGELEGLQATRERLTGEIQTARAARLAGVQDTEVPEIARLTADRVTLTTEVATVQDEIQRLEDRRVKLSVSVIEAENALAAATEGLAVRKAEFEEWKAEEMRLLGIQQEWRNDEQSELGIQRAGVQEAQEAVKAAEADVAEREAEMLSAAKQLGAERSAHTNREKVAQRRALELDAQAVDNNNRVDKIIEGRQELVERKRALIDHSDTLDTRETALTQREADLQENWKVLEEVRGQNAAG
jgi:DNA repair exonuclease SbcCD ATPase subunit